MYVRVKQESSIFIFGQIGHESEITERERLRLKLKMYPDEDECTGVAHFVLPFRDFGHGEL